MCKCVSIGKIELQTSFNGNLNIDRAVLPLSLLVYGFNTNLIIFKSFKP